MNVPENYVPELDPPDCGREDSYSVRAENSISLITIRTGVDEYLAFYILTRFISQ